MFSRCLSHFIASENVEDLAVHEEENEIREATLRINFIFLKVVIIS